MKIYEVGGCVRDSLLNIKSNDTDYSIEASSYAEMKNYILSHSKKIFLEKEEFGVIRYLNLNGVAEDISLCAKSRDSKGRVIEVGTIEEDLRTRDFTMNAIARLKGSVDYIDPLNGAEDIKRGVIKCVDDPLNVFTSDPARIIRAIRFKIQFGFKYDSELSGYFSKENSFLCLRNIDRERVRQELDRCFKVNSDQTIEEILYLGNRFREQLFGHHKLVINVR